MDQHYTLHGNEQYSPLRYQPMRFGGNMKVYDGAIYKTSRENKTKEP
jgi:hypothetical protein